jgi:hypothetical protein
VSRLVGGGWVQVVKDSAKERLSSGAASEKQVAAVLAEAEGLRRLVKLKGRELHNIRRLAHEVLLQRSDVETFLLSSLYHVRPAAMHSSRLRHPAFLGACCLALLYLCVSPSESWTHVPCSPMYCCIAVECISCVVMGMLA